MLEKTLKVTHNSSNRKKDNNFDLDIYIK